MTRLSCEQVSKPILDVAKPKSLTSFIQLSSLFPFLAVTA